MLYVTTRDKRDAHTAHRTLRADRGPGDGLYIPFQAVKYTAKEINQLKEKSFGQCVADILNVFFSARLDGWDVGFCIGRYPVKLVPMSHKILIAETWNNPEWDFARVVRNLSSRILGTDDTNGCPSNWAWIAVRIAFLFGLFGELGRLGLADSNRTVDISVASGDFTAPMAVWYAREMGLPIGKIIFSCNENSSAWDLLHHGELHTNAKTVSTNTPLCDCAVPADLERLIYAALGREEAERFVAVSNRRGVYTLTEEQLGQLSGGMFGAVVSQKRMESVIRNVYRTSTYLLGPYSALAFGGLQDYRATNVEAGPALILTEQGPLCALETVSKALGITVEELKERTGIM